MAQSRAAAKTQQTPVSTEVEKAVLLPEDGLRNIATMADAFALVEQAYGPVVSAEQELGDGFTLVKDLSRYVDVPVVILEWTFRDGDFGDTYVSFRFVAQTETGVFKGIYNDGGTGIKRMLENFTNRTGRMAGLSVRNGFRVSEYDTIKTGEPWKQDIHRPEEKAGKGKTWYLAV